MVPCQPTAKKRLKAARFERGRRHACCNLVAGTPAWPLGRGCVPKGQAGLIGHDSDQSRMSLFYLRCVGIVNSAVASVTNRKARIERVAEMRMAGESERTIAEAENISGMQV